MIDVVECGDVILASSFDGISFIGACVLSTTYLTLRQTLMARVADDFSLLSGIQVGGSVCGRSIMFDDII